MPASSTTKRFAPGNCLTSTTLVSSTPAGPTSTRPGSIATFSPLPRVAATMRAHVFRRIDDGRRRRRRCPGRRPCRDAPARCLRRAAPRASRDHGLGRLASGSSVVICEPMWTCVPTGCSAGRDAISRNSAGASSIGTPNLFDLRPVEMCGWLFASMSGLTRSATRATAPARSAR